MFDYTARRTRLAGAVQICELIFHSIVRSIRKSHNNAFVAIGVNLFQSMLFVLVFYLMFSLMGLKSTAVRGDFLLFVMSGVFLFMCHTKAVTAVSGAEGPNSAMMQHAPMNTLIAISSAALGSLYIQVLSMFVILFVYHVAVTPIEIENPTSTFGMVLMAWFTGCGVGLIFMALKPWFPAAVGLLTTIYQRANMIASGKMFLANSLPGFMLSMFDWNPLFHSIDQARGFVFLNYNPHYSSWEYPLGVGIVLLMIGLMGEFYTRQHVSLSWNARR